MKLDKTILEEVIYKSVDEVNNMLPNSLHLSKKVESVLIGKGGVYDSLSIINFLVNLEGRLLKEFGKEIVLLDEEIIANQEGPYRNLGTLMDRKFRKKTLKNS